jgi:hypothetical protein
MPTEVIHRNYHESGSRIQNFNADSTNTGHCNVNHFYPVHICPVRLKKSSLLPTVKNFRFSKQQRANLCTGLARESGKIISSLHYLNNSLAIKPR